jgi:hypothetical protein
MVRMSASRPYWSFIEGPLSTLLRHWLNPTLSTPTSKTWSLAPIKILSFDIKRLSYLAHRRRVYFPSVEEIPNRGARLTLRASTRFDNGAFGWTG